MTNAELEAAARAMAQRDASDEVSFHYPGYPPLDPEKTWPEYIEIVRPILEAAERARRDQK